MNTDPTRLLAAIERNFAEINNALLKIAAHDKIAQAEITYVRMTFFLVAMDALLNDAIAHAIRVLDEHKDAASFWYLLKCEERVVLEASAKAGLSIDDLKSLSAKLRIIRDKSHFHIDRTTVKDPSAVWAAASVGGLEFIETLRKLAETLARTKQSLIGGELDQVTAYDGSDVPKLISAYEHCYGAVHGA